MRRFAVGTALFISALVLVTPSFGATISITAKYNRDQLRGACAAAGGTFEANLDGATCKKPCTVGGRPGTCWVHCDAGGNCVGSTPRIITGITPRLEDLLTGGQVRR